MTALTQALNDQPVVLDGGLATQLEQQGIDISGDLWSARLLRDDPAAIVAAHRAYFEAGAAVATTASYQASFDGFAAHGLDARRAADLMRSSIALAREASRSVPGRPTWVMASVGPYGATLADGSEYRGDYGLTVGQLRRFHRPRLETLAAGEPDGLALETIPCAAEAEALLAEVQQLGLPCWLSLTVAGSTTRAGEPLSEVFGMAREVDEVVAVGVNCSTPADVESAIEIATQATGKPAVAYPNSGEDWDAVNRRWTGDARFDPDAVRRWTAAGARLIGGCCRVGPEQIRDIATIVGRPITPPLG
jgi:homocysteine S-methyltransferase